MLLRPSRPRAPRAPIASDTHSQSVAAGGPIVLHDAYLVEKFAQLNHEKVPERIVHAKGGGAFGTFTTAADVSAYTRAALFQPGVVTDTLTRFSTVASEQGSPDTWRDPRGFATKFYTTEGNCDLVGNNTPVCFIRDGINFPTSSIRRSACPAATCATTTCSETSGRCLPSRRTG